ncbi:uncharacterized protein LOC129632090 [Bubalus kerabau]|uniref:uncharacterized protein LOC129632090 n=1 Tax=Bubalus carabanensis TaxID=3119969 RepID=UPI00244EDC11|nr:uncharacterized protein LOC129632090 [Bubalus carabanensis]
MGSLKRAALGGSTITFISRRREVPRSSRPARSFPRHSGMQTGLLGLVPALRLPSRHRLRFTEAESSRRGKCGAGDPAKRLRAGPPKPHAHASRAHPVGSCRWLTGALALLGRLPCGEKLLKERAVLQDLPETSVGPDAGPAAARRVPLSTAQWWAPSGSTPPPLPSPDFPSARLKPRPASSLGRGEAGARWNLQSERGLGVRLPASRTGEEESSLGWEADQGKQDPEAPCHPRKVSQLREDIGKYLAPAQPLLGQLVCWPLCLTRFTGARDRASKEASRRAPQPDTSAGRGLQSKEDQKGHHPALVYPLLCEALGSPRSPSSSVKQHCPGPLPGWQRGARRQWGTRRQWGRNLKGTLCSQTASGTVSTAVRSATRLTLNPGAKQVGPGSIEKPDGGSGAAARSLPRESVNTQGDCHRGRGAGSSQLAEAEG